MIRTTLNFSVTVLLHAWLLAILLLISIQAKKPIRSVFFLSEISEEEAAEERFEELVELEVNPFQNFGTTSASTLNSSIETQELPEIDTPLDANQTLQAQVGQLLGEQALVRPLGMQGNGQDLAAQLRNYFGENIEVSGDAGAVDQLTREIYRRLQRNKVLVAWVMDASGSMEMRRAQLIERFSRVYGELAELGVNPNEDTLLTGIVAYGQNTVFMTPKPTSDPAVFKRAVEEIKPDESGVENVFTAVHKTCLEWRRHQTHGRRQMLIVVLTDEIGEDTALVDETCAMLDRFRIPTFVLGPAAPFGRKEVMVNWTDPPTGETFQIPITRGPESVLPEHMHLPFWGTGPQYDLFSSGFGPFALTRLARESGGAYFLQQDPLVGGPIFAADEMAIYAPDYSSYRDYIASMRKNPMRIALIEIAKQSYENSIQQPLEFSGENLNAQFTNGQKVVAELLTFLGRAVVTLEPFEKDREQEETPRWRAHFDLAMGRLLANRVRSNEYNWTLAQMKVSRPPFKDPKNNSWRLVHDDTIQFGATGIVGNDKKPTDEKTSRITEEAQKDAKRAIDYLQRVIKEHPQTPWSMMAERELAVPLGFKWEEYYVAPPPPPGEMPRNPEQQQALERIQRREEARKRIPNL